MCGENVTNLPIWSVNSVNAVAVVRSKSSHQIESWIAGPPEHYGERVKNWLDKILASKLGAKKKTADLANAEAAQVN